MGDHRFAPASPDEPIVYGAAAPGFTTVRNDGDSVANWIETIQAAGIQGVCCLLTDRQLQRYDGLLEQYRAAFGHESVSHAPIQDHTLADPKTVTDRILPFFAAADARSEPIVTHCLAGIGRTGHVLAAWLVAGRGFTPDQAIRTVSESGRNPREAIEAGNATEEELTALLETV
ncbi:MAG: protein-tyrosine phosphatase [Halobacteriales archaeon]|jgi:protein-tyrosine phosphatase